MSVDSQKVMQLRAATGLGMMACKKALIAESGDYEKAIERLRKEGLKRAEGKAGRATGEGLVVARISADGLRGTMVEVDCESEPVSNTDLFRGFVDGVLDLVDRRGPRDLDALLAEAWPAGGTVEEALKTVIAKLGENMRIRGFSRLEATGPGTVGHYVHHDRKIGAVVALAADRPQDLADLAKEVSMHVVFSKPQVLRREDVPADVREREIGILREQVQEDPKMASKPAAVRENVVEGKMRAFYEQWVLPEQPWFRDGTMRVEDVVKARGARITAFGLYQVGA